MSPRKRVKRSSSRNDVPTASTPEQSPLNSPSRPHNSEVKEHENAKRSIDDIENRQPTIDNDNAVDDSLFHEDELFTGDENTSPQQIKKSSPSQFGKAYGASGGYNALKSFNGQVYKGMAVGGSHLWNYDPGVWKETKEEPDLWKVDYKTTKRRAKNAPTGSGAPVGTGYHWLIVAHQYVTKIDANTYETHLEGSKYKLAHKNASSSSWSIPKVQAQRDREVELLEDAKRRVQGLPPVLASEKVKVEKQEKGQRKLDSLFSKSPARGELVMDAEGKKRKR